MNDLALAKKYVAKSASAQARGIEFTLSFTSYKNLMRSKRCYFTKIELTKPSGKDHAPTDRTIDRIDNGLGYVKGNVVAMAKGVNSFKGILENPAIAGINITDMPKLIEKFAKEIQKRKLK